MAKKSAASKGFRKTAKKKPFLTKNDIIITAVIVAAIIVAVILFNVFYGAGYLKLADVKTDDVVSIAAQKMTDRYVKVAEAGQLDGFTRTDPTRETSARGSFLYMPDEPVDSISYITLDGSFLNATELADTNIAQLPAYSMNGTLVMSGRSDVRFQDHDACVINYTNSYADQDEEGNDIEGSDIYTQNIGLYVSTASGYTVCFHINFTGEDDSFYMSEEECVDYILDLAGKLFTVYDAENV